jgi:outer membrane protein OmpA-like peptidoglycan-associated protein
MRQLAAQRAQNVRDAILAAGDIAGERISIVPANPLSAEERAKLKGRPNRVDFSMK